MPTYSYRCTECDKAFDIQQAFTDDTLTVCPNCGGLLRKVFSPIGVSFTGSGFYRNDSRAKPASEKGAEKSGAEKVGAQKSTTDGTGSGKAGPSKPSDKPAKKEKTAAASTPSPTSGTGKAATSSTAS